MNPLAAWLFQSDPRAHSTETWGRIRDEAIASLGHFLGHAVIPIRAPRETAEGFSVQVAAGGTSGALETQWRGVLTCVVFDDGSPWVSATLFPYIGGRRVSPGRGADYVEVSFIDAGEGQGIWRFDGWLLDEHDEYTGYDELAPMPEERAGSEDTNDAFEGLLHRLRSQAQDAGVAVVGCTDDDMREIERTLGRGVPASYRRFMRVAGRQPGPALAGTDCTYPTVLKLRAWAEALLAECQAARLPADLFVFSMHQGYTFLALALDGRADPPVFQYVEGEEKPSQQWSTFSGYLAEVLGPGSPGRPR